MRGKIIKILSFVLIFACILSSGVCAGGVLSGALNKITYDAYPDVFSSAYYAGTQGLTKEQIQKNKDYIFDYLISIDFNSAVACGIMANIECESGFNPNVWGDNGTSYGICQWHSSRFEDMKKYCREHGLDYTTVSGQLSYLKAEMDGRLHNGETIYKYLKENVADTPDGAYEAGRYWCYHYEIPANKEEVSVKRGNKAKNEYWPIYGGRSKLTVTFISDGETVSVKTVKKGGKLTFDTLSKNGYDFLGWSRNSESTTAEFIGGKTYIINADSTLYAVWAKTVPILCQVNFDPMGGDSELMSKTVMFNEAYGELPVPVNQELYFVGWYTEAGARITEQSTVAIKTEHTLYAHWSEEPVKGFVKNVSVPAALTVKYKSTQTIEPKVEKDEGVECSVSFSSSNPAVISVDSDGNVKALRKGTATITCTVTDQYGSSVRAETKVTTSFSIIQLIIIILLFGWIWY